ncbi:olfactory receptor 49-like [Sphaeramia orbicularis]|uniref:olfactory receptor 49-like n=1 Tax=Sphaeramia orbicularis TaxID=375764 RepID=UPI00117EA138|nr:olfactory receptor 49-like [Sphaeramia orbicularis]
MMENVSVITLFTLSGLNFTIEQRITLFVLTLLWYLLILFGNFTIIFVIVRNKSLHEPMYIFLCNLCINALYGTVGFYPKFLLDLVFSHVISYTGCMLQGFVIHSSTCGDFSILTLMAYDRYVAICRPLTYHSVMTKHRVYIFVFFSWFVPLFCMFMNTATLLGKKLCGSHIQRIYCINWNVASLACSPSKAHVAVGYFNMLFYFGHFLFVFWSYMYLIKTCMLSKENFQKFMQTCLPHLICLIIYSFSVLLDLLYMRLGSVTLSQDLFNFMAIEFLLIPPVVNPLIYGLKLTKIRTQLLNFFYMKRSVHNKSP